MPGAFIEVRCKDGQTALIEGGSIAGVVTSPNMSAYDIGTDKLPVAIILRAGVTIHVVGESAAKLLVRATLARKLMRDEGKEIYVDFLGDGVADGHAEEVQESVDPGVPPFPLNGENPV